MRIFLIILLSGIVFVATVIGLRLLRRDPVNRYRKARAASFNQLRQTSVEKKEPSLGKNPLMDSFVLESDPDTVLGIALQSDEKTTTETSMEKNKTENIAKSPDDFFIALYLIAPKNTLYAGYELLQALLSAGLRFGEHRIFHRHEQKDGRGSVLFHCASAIAPGTFDLSKMGAFTSSGLCLFFSVNRVEDPLLTFDMMLNTVDQLSEDLGGYVLDEKHESFTKETMIRLRQKIRSIEANKTTLDMFATT